MADTRGLIARQFELQTANHGFVIVDRLPSFKYRLRDGDDGDPFLAICLATSWQFYELRMNLGRYGIEFAIVGTHDAILPIRVLELRDGYFYADGQPPQLPSIKQRRTAEQRHLLLSQIILGSQSAGEELAKLSPRSRARYQSEAISYLSPKRGRPWGS